jgi:hypothetical protein
MTQYLILTNNKTYRISELTLAIGIYEQLKAPKYLYKEDEKGLELIETKKTQFRRESHANLQSQVPR